MRNLAEEHRGLILVTGATGVGKTTTLASMLGHINRTRRQHIVTIEDPIEILHSDERCIVNQREVGLDTESFNQALRRVLRQDPDVILIGELRDAETAETALQAAESGHLVLSTMHTLDAAETVARMVEFFPAVKQAQVRSILAGVLRGVVSQRLVPRIDGGRVAAVEVMVANRRIADLIREDKAEEITDAIAEGEFFHMQTLTAALIELVLTGEVDRDVAAGCRAEPPRLRDRARARAQGAGRARGRRDGTTPATPPSCRRPSGSRDAPPPVRRRARLRGRLAASGGYSLSEMLVVLAILGIVIAALTQLFVSASNAQVDMTRRFEAQQDVRLALDKLRREIHCASAVDRRWPTSSIVISLGSYCPSNTTGAVLTWCTKDKTCGIGREGSRGVPYSLWRHNGSACTGTGRKEADYLTTGRVFTGHASRHAGGSSAS